MLAIHSSKNPQQCTPNLLPAQIKHNGLINNVEQYWKTDRDEKEIHHAYFRGRHLHGTSLALPSNYTGAVLQVTDKNLPQAQQARANGDEDGSEEQEEIPTEVKVVEQVGEFDEVIVWGHGDVVDGEKDGFVRGLQEWVGWAESMHVDEDKGEDDDAKKD